MIQVKVVLAAQESDYIEPLVHYVDTSEYKEKMLITAFTRLDSFMEYMNGDQRPDVVVAEACYLEPWLAAGEQQSPWVMLGSDISTTLKGTIVSKYQPLPELLSAILESIRGQGARATRRTDETMIIGVVSAVGGSGKSTTALNMAKQLGSMGASVFYLNLENVNSSSLIKRHHQGRRAERDFSRLLYELVAAKEKKEEHFVEISQYTVLHDGLKADIFEPSNNLKELLQLDKELTRRLIQLIASSGQYEIMIVDSEEQVDGRFEAILEESHSLVWMLLDDMISMYKSEQRLSFIERNTPALYAELLGKSKFIVNRFVGNLANPLPAMIRDIDGVLPYIPSWKQVASDELIMSSPIFQRDILKLAREITGDLIPSQSGVMSYG